jgi:hypothetical protein
MIEGSMEVGGAVVFWTAAEFTDRVRLQAAFDGLGLGPYVPDPRPDSAVLREALEEVCGGPRVLVRPLADRDGFAVVKEDRGSTANSYTTLLVARVSGTPPRLHFEPHSLLTADVQRAFDKHRGRVPAAQLSACLVKVVESLGGTRLRPTGAVYWVPGHRVSDWADVAAAVEGASEGKPSAVYLLRHRIDPDAVRAVRDAVVAEVQTEATRIRAEVLSGELGGRALETRQRLAHELRDKVLLYEHLLHVGLDDLHAAVDAADQAAASATLLLSTASDHTSQQPVPVG